ncbi:C40 family peptidase [Enterococcus sp.]|uniref:C40 family peptidase n=1 Tax=Enterococcus sp. TaxID=35783 RepID=UPI0029139E0E|nr:C40 family peptidase [Enterococcus sp.]MDU5336811.1 C40 family peptidase [Enterococcus sp.]
MKKIRLMSTMCLFWVAGNLMFTTEVYGEDNQGENTVQQETKVDDKEQLNEQYESDNRKKTMSFEEYENFRKTISSQNNSEYNRQGSPELKANLAATSVRDQIVAEAKKHLGKPYTQTNPTRLGPNAFDCSGLAYYVYKTVTGKDIKNVTWEQEYSGDMISVAEAKPGDLYFWGARGNTYHVAICIGNNQYVHAPDFGKTVEISPIWDEFRPSFAVRILPDTPVQKFKVNDRVKIKKTATHWVGSGKLSDYDYTRVLIVEEYQSNGVKLRIPGEWAGIIKEADLEKATPAFKKGDYVKIKRTATKWVGSSNLAEEDYQRTHIVEGINSNGAITIRIPGSWAGNIREEDLERDISKADFKVGTNVSFGMSALKWIGSSTISYDDMMRPYKISKVNDDGTFYVRTLDDAWGGNISINDMMLKRSNSIGTNDVVKLRAAATNWADGKPINIENKTTRSFIVKERKDNKLHIYSDAASGWSAWLYDWDAVLERKHKTTPETDYNKKYVVMNQNSSVWNAYKGVSSNVKISLNEYDSVYKVVDKNSEATKIQSVADSSIFGWVYNNQVSAAPNNTFARGDKVKLKSSASRWASGETINIDNKTTRTFLIKERKDNQLLLYSDAGWQAWAYDWDVAK